MTDLERYRDEIDEIDSEIVRLFEKRMKVSEEVAEYKIKTGKQVLDPARESQKIHTLKKKLTEILTALACRSFSARSWPSAVRDSISCLQNMGFTESVILQL